VVLGLVATNRVIGSYNVSPFKFEPHNISIVSLQVNGDTTETHTQELCTVEGSVKAIEAYENVFQTLNLSHTPCTIDLKYDEFKKSKTLFVFELNKHSPGSLPLPRYGNIKIELKFRVPTVTPLTVMCYTETNSMLHIDHVKSVYFKDFIQPGK
jgi:hypothetical protein